MKFNKMKELESTNTIENILQQKEGKLQKRKKSLELLKQKQKDKLDSLPLLETQLKEIEEKTEEQHKLNRKFKKKRLIFIILFFIIIALGDISFKLFITTNNNNKITEYAYSLTEKENEYRHLLESITE